MKIGVIGGSGINVNKLLFPGRYIYMQTPFGDPSDKIAVGSLGNVRIFFIPRHGGKHSLPPSAVNYRANIWCLKALGCTHVIGTTATSSLKDTIKPGDLLMLSSFINRTTRREGSFFNGELGVGHVPMQPSFSEKMNKLFYYASQDENYTCHLGGMVVTVEGPRFASAAESALYNRWGADVINMTTLPEVCLARELSMLYVCIASVTDYCHWNFQRKRMGLESVIKIFEGNGTKVTNLIKKALPLIEKENWDKEIRLLEKTVEKSTYKKGVPMWSGPYYPPWILDKQSSLRNDLYRDIYGPIHDKQPTIDSSYIQNVDPTISVVQINPNASSSAISTSALTPSLQQNMYTLPPSTTGLQHIIYNPPITSPPKFIVNQPSITDFRPSAPIDPVPIQQSSSSQSQQHNIYPRSMMWPGPTQPTTVTHRPLDNIMILNQSLVGQPSPHPTFPKPSSSSHPMPDATFPREIQTTIHQPSAIIHPPPTLAPPPSAFLQSKQTLYRPQPMVVHSPPTIFDIPQSVAHPLPVLINSPVNSFDPTARAIQSPTAPIHPAPTILESPTTVSQPTQVLLNSPAAHMSPAPTVIHLSSAICHSSPTVLDPPYAAIHPPPLLLDSTSLRNSAPTVINSQSAAFHPPPTVLESPPAVIHSPPILLDSSTRRDSASAVTYSQSAAIHSPPILLDSTTRRDSASTVTYSQSPNIHPPPTVLESPPAVIHSPPILLDSTTRRDSASTATPRSQSADIHSQPIPLDSTTRRDSVLTVTRSQSPSIRSTPTVLESPPDVIHPPPTFIDPTSTFVEPQQTVHLPPAIAQPTPKNINFQDSEATESSQSTKPRSFSAI